MMSLRHNYYFSSFFWTTLARILTALFGFITTPLLLALYGKANYGILILAISCNGYMHLLDLGMNIGAVKFFSQWRVENKDNLIQRVANTNQTFYLVIAAINIIALLALAIWGAPLFNITSDQFTTLRECLLIIALFCAFSWETTPFQQLLIADKQMAFTSQMQCVTGAFKLILVGLTIWLRLPLTTYFLILTALTAILIVPYASKCRRDHLIASLRPRAYWADFRSVFTFSLAIFTLSLFQTTATQSRPIILGIFAADAASTVADFNIIQVFPNFIIMLAGTFAGIFLPQTSRLVAQKDQPAIEQFAYKWTIFTTIFACLLCFPFMLGAKEALSAYVGPSFLNLSVWLVVWVVLMLLQVHSTPCNALILAYGKTKLLVYMSAGACVISIGINAALAHTFGAGSAVIGYTVYILINLIGYYAFFYKQLLRLSNWKIIFSFLAPTLVAILAMFPLLFLQIDRTTLSFIPFDRVAYLALLALKGTIWAILFAVFLLLFHIIRIKEKRILTLYG